MRNRHIFACFRRKVNRPLGLIEPHELSRPNFVRGSPGRQRVRVLRNWKVEEFENLVYLVVLTNLSNLHKTASRGRCRNALTMANEIEYSVISGLMIEGHIAPAIGHGSTKAHLRLDPGCCSFLNSFEPRMK
jgi:hypothetical protein